MLPCMSIRLTILLGQKRPFGRVWKCIPHHPNSPPLVQGARGSELLVGFVDDRSRMHKGGIARSILNYFDDHSEDNHKCNYPRHHTDLGHRYTHPFTVERSQPLALSVHCVARTLGATNICRTKVQSAIQ
jgi:hypothetical protein